jgi:hypothetical protein
MGLAAKLVRHIDCPNWFLFSTALDWASNLSFFTDVIVGEVQLTLRILAMLIMIQVYHSAIHKSELVNPLQL